MAGLRGVITAALVSCQSHTARHKRQEGAGQALHPPSLLPPPSRSLRRKNALSPLNILPWRLGAGVLMAIGTIRSYTRSPRRDRESELASELWEREMPPAGAGATHYTEHYTTPDKPPAAAAAGLNCSRISHPPAPETWACAPARAEEPLSQPNYKVLSHSLFPTQICTHNSLSEWEDHVASRWPLMNCSLVRLEELFLFAYSIRWHTAGLVFKINVSQPN